MNFQLKDLQEQSRAIGRAVALVSPKRWVPGTPIALQHLGDTEGEIAVAFNDSYVHMTLPELTGPAKHDSFIEGDDPVVSIPLFAADPELRLIASPTGSGSGGYGRRRRVTSRTLVLMPEELFYDEAGDSYDQPLAYTAAGGWTLGGAPLTDDQTRLLALSIWLWKGYFTRPGIRYRHEDAGKLVETVNFQVQYAPELPDGHRLYTVGDPADYQIEIDPAAG